MVDLLYALIPFFIVIIILGTFLFYPYDEDE